ncbi:hypothetical protein FHS78_001786 [Parvibaculum indicum]|uniref:phasin family protein n=1 Tax=Parvibaculum indicum TaxID=562969 RepID=UPI0014236035|nr:phasin family protein [Parvibaculum indicum]NIJ41496.1 hypothetical protein [Parvibaculum indicum]
MSHAKPARSYFALSPEEKAALVQFQIADPLLATSRCLAACSKGVKAWEEEVIRFSKERMDENAETFDTLSTLKSPLDLASMQREWFHTASRAYIDEASHLMKVVTETTESIWSSVSADGQ